MSNLQYILCLVEQNTQQGAAGNKVPRLEKFSSKILFRKITL